MNFLKGTTAAFNVVRVVEELGKVNQPNFEQMYSDHLWVGVMD